MLKKLPRCEFCGRSFHLDRYNSLHQRYCTDEECVLERKRKRQREWYARRRTDDPAFRAQENFRCAEANRCRRARGDPAESVPSVPLFEVVTGLLCQLTDTVDPVRIRSSLHAYAARGRKLALAGPTGAGPP